jgi:ribosomal protein L21E
MVRRFDTGDRVRIDIPDESDPDHQRLHGRKGVIIDIVSDDAGIICGDDRESFLFRIELSDSEIVDVRWRDIRPI